MRIPVLLVAAFLPCSLVLSQAHPHFDDGGALQWQTGLAAAKVAAKKADKLIFLEYGRAA